MQNSGVCALSILPLCLVAAIIGCSGPQADTSGGSWGYDWGSQATTAADIPASPPLSPGDYSGTVTENVDFRDTVFPKRNFNSSDSLPTDIRISSSGLPMARGKEVAKGDTDTTDYGSGADYFSGTGKVSDVQVSKDSVTVTTDVVIVVSEWSVTLTGTKKEVFTKINDRSLGYSMNLTATDYTQSVTMSESVSGTMKK